MKFSACVSRTARARRCANTIVRVADPVAAQRDRTRGVRTPALSCTVVSKQRSPRVAMRELFHSILLIAAVFELCACGGGDGTAPPVADFSVSLSTSSLSAQVGSTTSPLVIAIRGLDGFSDTVSVALQNVPNGVTVLPSSAFSLAPGATQSVTFRLADSAAVGPVSITVMATSGTRSHGVQIELIGESIVRTYQIGSRLYLESGTTADKARLGLETTWGGS